MKQPVMIDIGDLFLIHVAARLWLADNPDNPNAANVRAALDSADPHKLARVPK